MTEKMKQLTWRFDDNEFEQFAQEKKKKKISLSDCLRNVTVRRPRLSSHDFLGYGSW